MTHSDHGGNGLGDLRTKLRDIALEYSAGMGGSLGVALPLVLMIKKFSDTKGLSSNKPLPPSFIFPEYASHSEFIQSISGMASLLDAKYPSAFNWSKTFEAEFERHMLDSGALGFAFDKISKLDLARKETIDFSFISAFDGFVEILRPSYRGEPPIKFG